MDSHLSMIIICAVFLLIGVILGNGAVWVFNRIPGKWLVDYGEEPDEELLHPSCQRIKSTPWKYVFTGFFIVAGIKMGIDNPFYAFAAVLAVWLLLEMSIADIKYMIVPDQFLLMLLVCGLGMIPQTEGGPLDCLIGAAIGLVLTGTIALIGRLVYRKSAVGGADIKLFTALGLLTGMEGILFIFVVSTFASAGHFAWLLLGKRAKRTDERPWFRILQELRFCTWYFSAICCIMDLVSCFRKGFMERNILLTIEYDGSGFSGWQRQPGRRTVQGELERVLSRLCACDILINGTSRTDAGFMHWGRELPSRVNSEYRRKESCGPPTTFWRAAKIRSRLWVMSESQKYERCRSISTHGLTRKGKPTGISFEIARMLMFSSAGTVIKCRNRSTRIKCGRRQDSSSERMISSAFRRRAETKD